jgi:hypothetical protein
MHDIRPERVIALERENTELRECIDKLFQQITELSAKYEAPSDAVLTQQRALYDVPSHGMTNEMALKVMTTKQLAAFYTKYFFCIDYDPQTDEFEMVRDCPLKDLCVELDQNAPEGTVIECEDVIAHWLKTQYSEASELNIDK